MQKKLVGIVFDADILSELDEIIHINKSEMKNRSKQINKILSEWINKFNLEKEVEENGLVNSGK